MKYYTIKKEIKTKSKQLLVADKLIQLKSALQLAIPEKRLDRNLLLATWNIRDFDSNKFGHGPRMAESFYYIAQIISSFDLIAVQEVNKNLSALKRLMYLLGNDWDFVSTDHTEGLSGNMERMTFVYDTRRVNFLNIAGEVVLPKNKLIKGDIQFARTPFLVTFQAAWTKFNICTVHIFYGSDSGVKLERRKEEIAAIASFLKNRADKDKETFLVLGDFNIVDHEHETMKSLLDNGFEIPEQIRSNKIGTNILQNKFYDQIGIRSKSPYFKLGEAANSAGSINFFKQIFTEEQFQDYRAEVEKTIEKQIAGKLKDLAKEQSKAKPDAGKIESIKQLSDSLTQKLNDEVWLKNYYVDDWRTFQISDHLPLWCELLVDHSESYLKSFGE